MLKRALSPSSKDPNKHASWKSTVCKQYTHKDIFRMCSKNWQVKHVTGNHETKLTSVHGTPQTRNLMVTSSSYIFIAGRVPEELSSSCSCMSSSAGAKSILGGSPSKHGPGLPLVFWLSEGKTLLFCTQYSLKDARASWNASHVWLHELQCTIEPGQQKNYTSYWYTMKFFNPSSIRWIILNMAFRGQDRRNSVHRPKITWNRKMLWIQVLSLHHCWFTQYKYGTNGTKPY